MSSAADHLEAAAGMLHRRAENIRAGVPVAPLGPPLPPRESRSRFAFAFAPSKSSIGIGSVSGCFWLEFKTRIKGCKAGSSPMCYLSQAMLPPGI